MRNEIQEYDLKNISNIKFTDSRLIRPIYSKYLLRLLSDQRLNEFYLITNPNKTYKTCRVKFDNVFELKNCTPGEFGISLVNMNYSFHIIYHLNFTQLIDKNRIEKIIFILNKLEFMHSVEFHLSHSHPIPRKKFILESNFKTKISFSSFSVKKLSSSEDECISDRNDKDFSEEYYDFCLLDCVFDLYNQSFGCVSISKLNFYFKRNKIKHNYKLCNILNIFGNISIIDSISKECKKICKPKCDFVNFDTKIEVSNHGLKQTILEVIPKKSPRIAYIETLKTDLNRLIYNCGGILGLWFGISPIKAVDLFSRLSQIYRTFFNVCSIVSQFLIAFWIRFKQNMTTRVTPVVNRFGNGVQLGHNKDY
jgi:hypothetical protein